MSTKWEWLDIYLPSDVVRALAEGIISSVGLRILFIVRSLTIKRKWCWPTNDYIADAGEKISTRWVSHTISDLIEQGFLKTKNKEGLRRYLKLAWSWSAPKRGWKFSSRVGRNNSSREGGIIVPPERNKEKETKVNDTSEGKNGSIQHRWNWTMAVLIYNEVKKTGRVMNRPNFFQDSAAFSDLEKKVMKAKKIERNEARRIIESELHSHLRHLGDQFQPKAYDAWKFNQEFPRIEDARKSRNQEVVRTKTAEKKKFKEY